MKEVWSFQWRIAVSWLCGYFIFQLYNPVLFAYHGPVAAGQMGMSLSLSGALTAVAISWINTKAAPFGAMIARKEYTTLDRVFFQALKQSLAVCGAGMLTIWLLVFYLNRAHFSLAHRVLSPLSIGILLATAPISIVTFAEATYLRAHKQEKFLLNSIIAAILVGSSAFFLGRPFGALGIVTGTFLSSLIVGLPLGTYMFVRYRRLWHAV